MDMNFSMWAAVHLSRENQSTAGSPQSPLIRTACPSTPRKRLGTASLVLAAATWLSSASAAPILWDASFFNDAGLSATDFATFQSTMNTAMNFYSSTYESPNPLTVKVEFRAGTTGLGTTTSFTDTVSYLDYRNALAAIGTSADDTTALSHLPNTAANPVNSNDHLSVNLPLLRALGFSQGNNSGDPYDSSIVLNVLEMMPGGLDRSGPLPADKYDLLQVTYHELNEVLGFTSALNGSKNDPISVPSGAIGVADLFRYRADGVRSFTSDKDEAAYLSIDGGATSLANFNTTEGGDFQDFNGQPHPSVQDAFSTPGIRLNNAIAERTALDVIGYNYAAVPIPAAGWLFFSALASLGAIGRRRNPAAA